MIQKSAFLRCSPDGAFVLFTKRLTEWWPETHRPTKDPKSELFMEPSGRFWERARDGREVELGRVLAWEPPHRLKLDFFLGTSAGQPTAVEVTFTAGDEGTRVRVVHRATPASEELWNLKAPVFSRSWDALLVSLEAR